MDLKEFLNKVENINIDFDSILKTVAQSIDTEIIIRFDKEIDPQGRQWVGISYRKENGDLRDSVSGNAKILRDTGNMYRSFTKSITGKTLTIGNSANYFAKHQLGKGLIHQRQMLDTEGENKNEQLAIKEAIEKGFYEEIKSLF